MFSIVSVSRPPPTIMPWIMQTRNTSALMYLDHGEEITYIIYLICPRFVVF